MAHDEVSYHYHILDNFSDTTALFISYLIFLCVLQPLLFLRARLIRVYGRSSKFKKS